jgi:hypothetical protein
VKYFCNTKNALPYI